MQRQSLGGGSSPGTKHHHHHNINGAGGVSSSSSKEVSCCRLLFDDEEEEEASKEETTTTTMRKERGVLVVLVSEIEEQAEVIEKKMKKKGDRRHHHHLRSISSRTEKSIHLIPILTIFCLLILYLCSYDPPLKDLAHIDGFRKISKQIDSTTSTEINNGRFSSLELDDDDDDQINKVIGGDVLLPIRSHRSLHEIRRIDDGKMKKKSHRFHRKIGDY